MARGLELELRFVIAMPASVAICNATFSEAPASVAICNAHFVGAHSYLSACIGFNPAAFRAG